MLKGLNDAQSVDFPATLAAIPVDVVIAVRLLSNEKWRHGKGLKPALATIPVDVAIAAIPLV